MHTSNIIKIFTQFAPKKKKQIRINIRHTLRGGKTFSASICITIGWRDIENRTDDDEKSRHETRKDGKFVRARVMKKNLIKKREKADGKYFMNFLSWKKAYQPHKVNCLRGEIRNWSFFLINQKQNDNKKSVTKRLFLPRGLLIVQC